MRQPRAGRRGLFSFCICIILAFMGAVIHGQTTRPEQPPATQPAGPKFQDTRDRIAEVVAGVVTRTHGEKSWHQAPAVPGGKSSSEVTARTSRAHRNL